MRGTWGPIGRLPFDVDFVWCAPFIALASRAEPAENNPWFRCRAGELSLEVESVGVRADILPGGTGPRRPLRPTRSPVARKTVATPSPANTAKLLADNGTLMWLRGLEKVACEGKRNVVLGEKGLAARILNGRAQPLSAICRRVFEKLP